MVVRSIEVLNSNAFRGTIVEYSAGEETCPVFRTYDYTGQGYGWLHLAYGLWAIDVERPQGLDLSPFGVHWTQEGEIPFLTAWTRAEVAAKLTGEPISGLWKQRERRASTPRDLELLTLAKGTLIITVGRWTRQCVGFFDNPSRSAVTFCKHKSSNIVILPVMELNNLVKQKLWPILLPKTNCLFREGL